MPKKHSAKRREDGYLYRDYHIYRDEGWPSGCNGRWQVTPKEEEDRGRLYCRTLAEAKRRIDVYHRENEVSAHLQAQGRPLIVSIDWDYLFPNIAAFDWGHIENQFFIHHIWESRVGDQKAISMRPNYHMEERLRGLLNKRAEGAPLIVAESHSQIWGLLEQHRDHAVLSFDQHHDHGYGSTETPKEVDCSNWAMAAQDYLDIPTTVVYPKWRNDIPEGPGARTFPAFFDRPWALPEVSAVFVCRSGAWVPPWVDDRFTDFVQNLAAYLGMEQREIDNLDIPPERDFTWHKAHKAHYEMRRMMEALA